MQTTEIPRGPAATRRVLATSLAIILSLATAACGQRGPLFLPSQEPAAGSAAPAAATPEEQDAREATEEAADETSDPGPAAGKDDDEKAS